MKVSFYTLGCKVNLYESENIKSNELELLADKTTVTKSIDDPYCILRFL